jgi:hypothetical protein
MKPDDTQPRDVSWALLLAQLTCAGLIACALYAATINYLVTPYINQGSEAGRVVGVYEGYQRVLNHVDRRRELVLFWGSSMMREGVDCRLLETSRPQCAAYNFAVSGDLPSRRIVELPRVRALHPDCVVIGVSYPEVFESRSPFDDQVAVLPASAYEAMPDRARALLDANENAIATRSAWERFWWKRKYVFPAACWKLHVPDRSNPIPAGYTENLKAPFVYTKSVPARELKKFLDSRAGVYPPYTSGAPDSPAASLSGRSLKVIVSDLADQGIRVQLVNMPVNPLLSAGIDPARRNALLDYLRSLGGPLVQTSDCQDALPAPCFTDLVHLNAQGRAAFTAMMAAKLTGTERPILAQASKVTP